MRILRIIRPARWGCFAGGLWACLASVATSGPAGQNLAGDERSPQREAADLRHSELEEFIRRFQRTPTPPNYGIVNREQPRTGQADPMAWQRSSTRINYRAVGRRQRPAEVDRLPLPQRKLDISGIGDLQLQRPRTSLGDPLGFQRVLTTQDRWRLQRESLPMQLAGRQLAVEGARQAITSAPPAVDTGRARTYFQTAQDARYSRFNRQRAEPVPAVRPRPAPVEPRWLTFNHDHVAASRSVPARHGRTGAPSAASVSDRWFRRPPGSVRSP